MAGGLRYPTLIPALALSGFTWVAPGAGEICYEASASLMRNTPVPSDGVMTNGPAASEGAMANQVPVIATMSNSPVPSAGAMGNAVVAAEGELC